MKVTIQASVLEDLYNMSRRKTEQSVVYRPPGGTGL